MSILRFSWILLLAALLAACGGRATPDALPADTVTAGETPAGETTDGAVDASTPAANAEAAAAAPACEESFGFCVSAQADGAVAGSAVAGWASSINNDCAALAAAGAARILELPLLTGAGEQKITVALTRVGAYTGPGSYSLSAEARNGAMPDMFPTVEIGGRAFSNGEGSSAVVTVAADGSGTLDATNLVEIASLSVANPDPNARLNLSLQWDCRDEK